MNAPQSIVDIENEESRCRSERNGSDRSDRANRFRKKKVSFSQLRLTTNRFPFLSHLFLYSQRRNTSWKTNWGVSCSGQSTTTISAASAQANNIRWSRRPKRLYSPNRRAPRPTVANRSSSKCHESTHNLIEACVRETWRRRFGFLSTETIGSLRCTW